MRNKPIFGSNSSGNHRDSELHNKVRTCLWFDMNGVEAARFYVSLLPDSFIETDLSSSGGDPTVINFTLSNVPFMALNGGDRYKHSPAASISVLTKDQSETDGLWNALLKDGGEESMCGWITDRFGVSWQIVPEILPTYLESKDKAAASRAFSAMLKMRKLDIETIKSAFEGKGPSEQVQ